MALRKRAGTEGSSGEGSPRTSAAEVARVAYELFERRGCMHGLDQQDWFEAERVVRRRRTR